MNEERQPPPGGGDNQQFLPDEPPQTPRRQRRVRGYHATGTDLSQGTTPLDVPFQFVPLNGTTTVTEGTFLYLPIFFSDNSPPILGNFPNDVQNQFADAVYFFDPADGIGLEEVDVTVDNERTVSLGPEYVVGFNTRPLLDGATKDVQLATFLAPLSKGTHTIAVHVELDGAAALAAGIPPVFDTTATLIVK